ncbi:MAG: RNA polymerase sigma factor [Kiritimatiellales bacterium]|nr:RNA polymerase sigma factor [Kiritimatiellales bacterium]
MMNVDHASKDAAIIQRVLDGDVDAFEHLIGRHRNHVFGIVAGRVPSGAVEEVAQDIFVDAFLSLNAYSDRKPFGHWMARIALRRCCDYWRRHGRNRETAVSQLGEDQREWLDRVGAGLSNEDFERETKRQECRETLDWLLERLDAEDRMLVDMVYLSGLPLKEAAAAMEWSLANTKVRAMRARKKMRILIEELLT